jgi:hypothetical protein
MVENRRLLPVVAASGGRKRLPAGYYGQSENLNYRFYPPDAQDKGREAADPVCEYSKGKYYFSIDSFNESGITRCKKVYE